jgi:hypothetical protein
LPPTWHSTPSTTPLTPLHTYNTTLSRYSILKKSCLIWMNLNAKGSWNDLCPQKPKSEKRITSKFLSHWSRCKLRWL